MYCVSGCDSFLAEINKGQAHLKRWRTDIPKQGMKEVTGNLLFNTPTGIIIGNFQCQKLGEVGRNKSKSER